MSLKSLRASLMEDVIGENTRRDYMKEDLFTYNHRADRPLQRSELNEVAKAVETHQQPESLPNKATVREEIRASVGVGSSDGPFDRRELLAVAKASNQ